MKYSTRYFIKKALRILLRVFYMFPVCPNRIILFNMVSFTYGDNPKYINEYIKRHGKNKYQVIFTLRNPEENDGSFICVKPYSLKFFYYYLTSSIVVTNSTAVSYVPFRRQQLVINTWHGGGAYKKVYVEASHNKWAEKARNMHGEGIDYMMSACRAFTEAITKDMRVRLEKFLKSGTPKVDVFFEDRPEIKERVRRYYSLSEKERIILYAPTFRSDISSFHNSFKGMFLCGDLDIDYCNVIKAFEQRFGGTWRFAIRLHPQLENIEFGPDVLNFKDYPDMQELLYTVDALITDYSSSMWDFSFTFRPCFLYAPDVDQYERERGFHTSPSSWPFPLARSNEELERNILNFDQESYNKRVRKHHEDLGSYETGHACEKVFELIKKHVQEMGSGVK